MTIWRYDVDNNKKKQILAAIGILTLVLAILALFRYHQVHLESQRLAIEKKVNQTSKSKQLVLAEEALKALEGDMTDENINKAQEAVDQLKDSAAKKDFQKRIDVIKDNLAKKKENDKLKTKAEEAVNLLEKNPSSENLSSAQEAVNKVSDKDMQVKLQARIDKIRSEIEVQSQEVSSSEIVTEVTTEEAYQESINDVPSYQSPYIRVPRATEAPTPEVSDTTIITTPTQTAPEPNNTESPIVSDTNETPPPTSGDSSSISNQN